jgi:isoleucyl-tRNA synthetase
MGSEKEIFPAPPTPFVFSRAEKEILAFWKERKIYARTLEQRKTAPKFVFYEGPPTANGLPHPGHCLTRTVKDIIPRYKTMTGYYCERKAGWDTHGLPVEIEVCKELGILEGGKAAIESYGVERFNRACINSVFRYQREWEELTERIGFWVDLDAAYVTYHQSYVESVWWALKQLFDAGLLYRGHKVVWWWAQGGTALSAGEVGEGYRETDDPAITVGFPLTAESAPRLGFGGKSVELLVWTTTPWTLLSNCAAAVGPDIEYALVAPQDTEDKVYILASAVLPRYFPEGVLILSTLRGRDLIGLRYEPLFRYAEPMSLTQNQPSNKHWVIIPGDFVDTETGTGIVHIAPAFGEDDYRVCKEQGIGFLCLVKPDGTFDERVTDVDPHGGAPIAGQFCKAADKAIIRLLKERGRLLKQETYRHPYPFCPRADQDPLIQYARESWFIATSRFVSDFLQNNSKIFWQPEHIRDGRFGNFLETNVDWALSRERYWGTPLPIWVCEKTGYMECVASYAELLAKPDVQGTEVWAQAKAADPSLSEHLKVHKPYIDAITYRSPKDPSARMRRVPEVIDVWFDAGSMPFAQWGYPHQTGSSERFRENFPADFISEAIDQTRGWFYALLAISTLLFKDKVAYPHPFRSCICLGHILGEDGQKLSKRLKNYREPKELFEKYSADALRWSFVSKNAPTSSTRLSERIVEEAQREFLVRWYNVFSFFVIYANLDGFHPAHAPETFLHRTAGPEAQSLGEAAHQRFSPLAERSELDRWVLHELGRTILVVREHMEQYDVFPAARAVADFVDSLSNWYVRRSRPRFWASEWTQDKADAYWTLYECLVTLSQLAAPFVPFFSEYTYRVLTAPISGARESVHLGDYPVADVAALDHLLLQQMAVTREAVTLGLSARRAANIKVRQPLQQCELVVADPSLRDGLQKHFPLIRDELNVKEVAFTECPEQYVTYEVRPNFRVLGPKYGAKVKSIQAALAQENGAALYREMQEKGAITVSVEGERLVLTRDEVEVRLNAKSGFTAAQGRYLVVVLSTDITPELRREGIMRECIRRIQEMRKERRLPYDARVHVQVYAADLDLREVLAHFRDAIAGEVLASAFDILDGTPPSDAEPIEVDEYTAHVVMTPLR